MKLKVLSTIMLLGLASLASGQAGPPSVLVAQGTNCPTGWAYSESSHSRPDFWAVIVPARIRSFDGRVRPEVSVDERFVESKWPTAGERQAAITSGVLRHTPAVDRTLYFCSVSLRDTGRARVFVHQLGAVSGRVVGGYGGAWSLFVVGILPIPTAI